MLSRTEVERLAAMANALRPDWSVKSLCTWLLEAHATKAYRDVAVALAWIATDPATRTPKRMDELGPWWTAARAASSDANDTHYPRCTEPGHKSFPAANCGACRSEHIGGEGTRDDPRLHTEQHELAYTVGPALARLAMRQAGIPETKR